MAVELKIGDTTLEGPVAKADGFTLGTSNFTGGGVCVALELIGDGSLCVGMTGGGCGGGVLDELFKLCLVLGRLEGDGSRTARAEAL